MLETAVCGRAYAPRMSLYPEPVPNCPQCASSKVARIHYGEVDEEVILESEAGKIVLGGCCVFEDSPRWCCLKCKHTWGLDMECPAVDVEC